MCARLALFAAIAVIVAFSLSPGTPSAAPGSLPQRYDYQIWACRTVSQDGAWNCRNYGQNTTVYESLGDCRAARTESDMHYHSENEWFQCFRKPTWSAAEPRPIYGTGGNQD